MSEYALTSSAIQKRSRGVSVKRPSRSSAAAYATEWTSRSRPPSNVSETSAKTRAMSSSERTSQAVTSGLWTWAARSRTFDSIRSPWYVKATLAPPSASRLAIAHAIERLLATPRTNAVFPSKGTRGLYGSSATLPALAPLSPPRVARGALLGPRVRRRFPAGPAELRRADVSASPRRDGNDPEAPVVGTDPRHRHAQAAAARAGVRSRALRGGLREPAERPLFRVEGLPRAHPRRADGRDREAPAGDPVRADLVALPGHSQRDDRVDPGREAATTLAPELHRPRVGEHDVTPFAEPQPRHHRRGRLSHHDRPQRRGREDRNRRRRDRQHESLPERRRLHSARGLPDGRHEVHERENHRRQGVPGTRLRQRGEAAARPERVLPRDPRGRHRRRQRRDLRSGGPGPSGDVRADRRRAEGLPRQLPDLQRPDSGRERRRVARDG